MSPHDDARGLQISRLELAVYAAALAVGILGSMARPWAWFAGWLA